VATQWACGTGGGGSGSVSAERSELIVEPIGQSGATATVADGQAAVLLTAIARDSSGTPLRGREAKFTVTGTGNQLSVEAARTDTNGIVTARLASTRAEDKLIRVAIDGASIVQIATVRFVPGPVASIVFADSVAADVPAGMEIPDFKVLAVDAHGNATSFAEPVTLSVAVGPTGAVLSDPTPKLDGGAATFTGLAIQRAGTYVLRARSGNLEADAIPFDVVPGHAAQLSFASQPTDREAGARFTPEITVRIEDEYGNLVSIGATTVAIGVQGGDPDATVFGTSTVTSALGQAIFSDAALGKAGTGYVLVATSPGLRCATTLSFSVMPGLPDGDASSVSATADLARVGDVVTVTAIVRDRFGNPIPRQTMTVAATGAANTIVTPLPTDANGRTSALLTSTVAETKSVTGVLTLGAVVVGPIVVTFTPGDPSPTASSLVASPTTVKNDNTQIALTVTTRDSYGNPIPGAMVRFAASGNATITQPAPSSDAGVATGAVSSTATGSQNISAIVGTVVVATAQVTFAAPPRIVSVTGSSIVQNGASATLGVTFDGTPPFVVVWWKNGVRVPGAYFWTQGNSVSFTTEPLTTADNGASFVVGVYNSVWSVTGPAQNVDVVDLAPSRQIFTLYSNHSELYPGSNVLALKSIAPAVSGAGLTLGLAYGPGGLPAFEPTSSGATSISTNDASGQVTITFNDVASQDIQTANLTVWPGSYPGSGAAETIVVDFTSAAWRAAHDQSTPPSVTITRMDLPSATTEVGDWIIGQPTSDDVAFAQTNWGGVVAGITAPIAKAQALGRALIDQLEPHRGVPSDAMNTSPFQQYRLAISGKDYVWCVNFSAIFAHACKSFGIPARIVSMGKVLPGGPDYLLETGEGHATVEIFDASSNRWVWMDPTMYQLGMSGTGSRLLDASEVLRSLNDPDVLPTLSSIEYLAGTGVPVVVDVLHAAESAEIQHFFTNQTILAYTNRSLALPLDDTSNEDALFPRNADVALASVEAVPDGYGVRMHLTSSIQEFDHFAYQQVFTTDQAADRSIYTSDDGVIDLLFTGPQLATAREQSFAVWAVTASGTASAPCRVTMQFYSSGFYASFGQTSSGYIVFDSGGLPVASTAVRDWIVDSPSEDDVQFAKSTWGGAIPIGAPALRQAQALGAALLDELGGEVGVSSTLMGTLSPFDQYQRAMAGLDQVDSTCLALIFAHACNCLGIPARMVDMGTTMSAGSGYSLEAAGPHRGVEVFDAAGNRWAYLDLSLGVLGIELQSVGILNSAQLGRSLRDPTQAVLLNVLAYDPSARVLEIPLAGTAAGAFLPIYFQLRPNLRFARNSTSS
jgi:transglutaminase-like putative cysteine protease